MRLAAHTTGILDFEVDEGLAFLRGLGVGSVEVACAGVFDDRRYGDAMELATNDQALTRWRDQYARHEISVCALSVHGEPLIPDAERARRYSEEFARSCELAEKIGVSRLTLTAGLPEGAEGDRHPCWVAGLPPEFPALDRDVVRWQWEERLIPYWEKHAAIARDHGVVLCFEMTAWDLVHNPRTLLALREAIGDVVMCNFDPSHLWYQGIDPLDALDELAPLIALVHAKDTRHHGRLTRLNGLFDLNPRSPMSERAWTFATVGYGHDVGFWAEFVSRLRLIGYDDVLSIEHEDPYMSVPEGVRKAIDFLAPLLIETQGFEPADAAPEAGSLPVAVTGDGQVSPA
jgi:sugar phosphate isomerase/epimerase